MAHSCPGSSTLREKDADTGQVRGEHHRQRPREEDGLPVPEPPHSTKPTQNATATTSDPERKCTPVPE